MADQIAGRATRRTPVVGRVRGWPTRQLQSRDEYDQHSRGQRLPLRRLRVHYRPADLEGIDLSEQPDDYVCPNCQATKSHFQVDSDPDDSVEGVDAGSVDEDLDEDAGDELDADSDGSAAVVTSDDPHTKPRRVYTDTSAPSVSTLKELRDEGDLDPQPPYQRYEVWPPVKKIKLIESVLLGLPLPRNGQLMHRYCNLVKGNTPASPDV